MFNQTNDLQVCNHPELFEQADVRAPFSFSRFGQAGPLGREVEPIDLPYSTRNPIEYSIPQLIYDGGGLLNVPQEDSRLRADSDCLTKLMNIWSIDWIQRSLHEGRFDSCGIRAPLILSLERSSFSFLRFINTTPSEVHKVHISPLLQRRLMAVAEEARLAEHDPFSL
jgi:chromatin-remodeling ATPase INO80